MVSNLMQATYFLHTVPIQLNVDDAEAWQRLQRQWQPFAQASPGRQQPIHVRVQVQPQAPAAPSWPVASTGPDITYFRSGPHMAAFFPGWGRFDVNLEEAVIIGRMARAAVQTYGVFEEMLLIALAPLLRRRGYYTIHAFAAALETRALLILGESGAGKTTTGLSLLARGARLVANDTPLLHPHSAASPALHAYPGLLSAYPDSVAHFPQLGHLLQEGIHRRGSDKISFAAESIWPHVWVQQARPAALVFPALTPGLATSRLTPMRPFEALQQLIGQSIEDWDTLTIPAHLQALRQLVDAAPAWRLHLAPDIPHLPDLLLPLLQ